MSKGIRSGGRSNPGIRALSVLGIFPTTPREVFDGLNLFDVSRSVPTRRERRDEARIRRVCQRESARLEKAEAEAAEKPTF